MAVISNRQIVSDIVGSLASLNIDDRFSRRFILSILVDKTELFIKQDGDQRRLFLVTDIWKSIPCLDMCDASTEVCAGVPGNCCNSLRVSKVEIPEVFESSYGDIIKVMTVDHSKEYTQTKIFNYKDLKNREYQDPNKRYFWILDRHIYIPDSDVKQVFVIGLFKKPYEVDKILDPSLCVFPLDYNFPCPDYLLDVVKTATKQELASIYKKIIQDSRPDQDPNKKD